MMNPSPANQKTVSPEIQNSELHYRRLFEAAQDGIMVLDAATGHVIDANPALLEILGELEKQVIGKSLGDTGLFKDPAAAEAALAEINGQPVGFALWFSTFSTFRGQPGLYLEDLFVRPEHRSRGIGKALLAVVAAQAIDRGCGRVEWSVLKWNSGAIGFYRSFGAQILDELSTCRIDEEPLQRLADLAPYDSRSLSARNPTDD